MARLTTTPTAAALLLAAVALLLTACITSSRPSDPAAAVPVGEWSTGTVAAQPLPHPPLSLPSAALGPAVATGRANPAPVETAAPVTAGDGWGPAPLTGVPDPPRLLALPGDFVSPEAVAAVYLAAWCYTPIDQNANTNLQYASRWMTAAGWTDDTSRAVDEPTWAQTQAAGVGTVCGPVTATVSVQGPNTPTTRWVAASAMQARTRGGVLIGQSPVTVMRRVLLATGGRWLVDVRVNAG